MTADQAAELLDEALNAAGLPAIERVRHLWEIEFGDVVGNVELIRNGDRRLVYSLQFLLLSGVEPSDAFRDAVAAEPHLRLEDLGLPQDGLGAWLARDVEAESGDAASSILSLGQVLARQVPRRGDALIAQFGGSRGWLPA